MNIQADEATLRIAAVSDGIFIDNAFHGAASGRNLAVLDPATGREIARIADGTAADIDAAVAAARRALSGEWGTWSALERGRVLADVGRAILTQEEDLARLESADTGKPKAQALGDIRACARYFEYYGAAADKLHGDTIPYRPGHLALTETVPHGVTGHIIPWNLPAQMFGRTIAPALAMGNACVLKPAEDACLTPIRLCMIAAEAGLPMGALNCVPGRGETAGAALSAHPGIDFISFTGSPEVGELVQIAAARNHIGCTLELGGKSPHLVFDDADLDAAVPAIVAGIAANAGQTCSAGSRVLVQEGIRAALLAKLAKAFSKLEAGPPGSDSQLGPLISLTQKRRVERFFAQAEADGLPLLAAGRIAAGAEPAGFFVEPRVYGPVPHDNRLNQEEIFGPVLSVTLFADEEEALRLANGTDYGLAAAVWSVDGGRALRVARRIRAGQVFVNGYGVGGGVELPFGGMKKSGHGREKGFAALRDFSTTRTLVVRHG